MALTLQTIINFTETPFRLKLLAGKNGLKKTVSWIYYTEDTSTIEFIRGGELAVTLGINYERQKDNLNITNENHLHDFLLEYIDAFIEHGGTGLIVNTGKYILEIPKSIIDYCEKKDFPLFTMPWEIHTIDLMQEVGNMISSDNQNSNTVEKYFYRAIFEKDTYDPKQIENTPFHNAKTFTIVLLELNKELFNNDIGKIKRYIQYSFNTRFHINQNDFSSFIHKNKVIYIVKNLTAHDLKNFYNNAKADKYFKASKISVSDTSASVEDLHDLYKHASVALEINAVPDAINYYESLGLYKILVAIKDKKVLQSFYDEQLGQLNEMEVDKREDYLKTLSLYLKTGGNVLKVAELNNAHRNTILYRINRLEELLNVDFSDGETRTALQTALYIKNLLT